MRKSKALSLACFCLAAVCALTAQISGVLAASSPKAHHHVHHVIHHHKTPSQGHLVGGASPNWPNGYVPSWIEWKNVWASKIDEGEANSITATMLVSGAAAGNLSSYIPNLSTSVEGTGTPGIDGAHWMIYHAPSTVADASNASLRVQRSASYPNSGESGTAKAIWGLGYTSPTGSFDEWTITGELHNQTDATLGTPSGGVSPENVAVNGTAFKQFASGFSYGVHEISPTWGGNFVCNDQTGVVSPWNACIGTEIDNYYVGGVGPDTHNSRVGLQIAWGGQGTPLATDHVSYGILFGGDTIGVMDHALYFGGSGTYGIGLDFSGATFNTAPVFLAGGQKIVFDGASGGTYNWALSDIAGTMALRYGSTNGMTLDSSGNFNATGNIDSAASISANGSVTAGTIVSTPSLNGPSASTLYIEAASGQSIAIGANALTPWVFDTTNAFRPYADNTESIGSSGARVATGYFYNLGASGSPVSNIYAQTMSASTAYFTTIGAYGEAVSTGYFTALGTTSSPVTNIYATTINNATGANISLVAAGCQSVSIGVNGATPWLFGCTGSFTPDTDNARPIGSASLRWSSGFFTNLGSSATPVTNGYFTNITGPTSAFLSITAGTGQNLALGSNGSSGEWDISTGGVFYPTADNTYSLGASGSRISTGYFVNLGASGTPVSKVYSTQNLVTAALPTISSCGTSPPAASSGSNANSGQFTLGTGSTAACTVTFATAYPTYAYCTVTPASSYTGTYYISAQSASAFTVTLGTGTASVKFNYSCAGN